VRILSRQHRAGESLPDAGNDELNAELTASYWAAYDERIAAVSFRAMVRQLPGLISQAVRLGWEASRRDTTATIVLNLASGIFTGYALLATTGVLEALVAAGPTPHRVRAALPSLVLVAMATAARAGLQSAAGWAQSRLQPQVDRVVELRLLDLTSQVELAAFDDARFNDAMLRARDRGTFSAHQVVSSVLDCVTAAVGIVAAASVVAVLQPGLGRRAFGPDRVPDQPRAGRQPSPEVDLVGPDGRTSYRGRAAFLHAAAVHAGPGSPARRVRT
jgi:ATP-binding cassette, subfamily B, bacterial